MIIALTSPALGQNINTLPAWNGTNSISAWGVTDTATYGQTITPVAGQTVLNGFTFELGQLSGTAPQYQAYVYQWNSATNRIVGAPLYASAAMTAPSGAAFTAVTINTGSIVLTPGQQYVLFLNTSNQQPEAAASYKYGSIANTTAYPAGQFVFQNNGANFASLSTTSWSTIASDLAFMAMFGALPIVAPLPPPPPPFIIPLLPAGTSVNPTHVAAAIDRVVAGGATVPAGYTGLYTLAPTQLVGSLSQLSGESNTQAQQGAFQLTNSYLSSLTDPFTANRGIGAAIGFAPEREGQLPSGLASAYAMYNKAPPSVITAPHWDVWGAGFGGSNTTSGNAVLGSHDTTSKLGGVAAGADYRFSPDALAGFSLAGGATSWSLAQGFGGGRSDVLLAGLYGAGKFGAAYVSAAFSFSNYWMATSRTVTVAGLDQLQASFNAQSYGGRLEGGYHLPSPIVGLQWTPYAAIQLQSFRTPTYGEIATIGLPQFALNYSGQNATAARAELGGRADRTFALVNGSQLEVFGKAAWAHDEISAPNLNVSFIGLPIASFAVDGAAPPRDLALVTAGAEWHLANGVSLMAKFDGEFANGSQTYTGTGRLRYTW